MHTMNFHYIYLYSCLAYSLRWALQLLKCCKIGFFISKPGSKIWFPHFVFSLVLGMYEWVWSLTCQVWSFLKFVIILFGLKYRTRNHVPQNHENICLSDCVFSPFFEQYVCLLEMGDTLPRVLIQCNTRLFSLHIQFDRKYQLKMAEFFHGGKEK